MLLFYIGLAYQQSWTSAELWRLEQVVVWLALGEDSLRLLKVVQAFGLIYFLFLLKI